MSRERVQNLDWDQMALSLWTHGYAPAGPLLSASECDELIALYADDSRFRSRIDMERYRFGHGDYKYFADPIPPLVEDLRESVYPHLAGVANEWNSALRLPERFPTSLTEFHKQCLEAGQTNRRKFIEENALDVRNLDV